VTQQIQTRTQECSSAFIISNSNAGELIRKLAAFKVHTNMTHGTVLTKAKRMKLTTLLAKRDSRLMQF
jgi:hypothetical protein